MVRAASWVLALAVGAFVLAVLARESGIWAPAATGAGIESGSPPPGGAAGRRVAPLDPAPEEPAWIRNAAPTPARSARPRIALVIDDLGADGKALKRILALPGPLTLAFLPYTSELSAKTARARRAGHELLVHLPMAAQGSASDPGPMALEPGLSAEKFERRLRWNLSRFPGFVGINNHMGSRLTRNRAAMRRLMRVLAEEGLLFLDSRTTPESIARAEAARAGVPHAARDVFLDNEASREAIADRLDELERLARKAGTAVGIGHPRAETIAALARWLPELEEKGIALVPLSAVVTVPGKPAKARAAGGS